MYNKHRNMFLNTFARKEDLLISGKYNTTKVPPNTARHGPLESYNSSYDKSNRVRFSKTQYNKYGRFLSLNEAYVPNLSLPLCLEPFEKFLVVGGGGGG